MFSLKQHARKNVRIVAMGAAAVSLSCITNAAFAAYHFDEVYWDPTLSATGTGSGGTGTLDNTTVNIYNPRWGGDQTIFNTTQGSYPAHWDAHHPDPPYDWQSDSVHFATTGGTVTINAPTDMGYMKLDVGGYTFNGAAITIGGGYGNHFVNPLTVLSQTTGNNTINSTLFLGGYNSANLTNIINVTAGTLTLADVHNGNSTQASYSNLRKAGAGTVIIGGTLNLNTQAWSGLFVDAGMLSFTGGAASGNGPSFVAGNDVNQSIEVASGATLSGGGGVRISGAQPSYNGGNPGGTLPHFTVLAGGHLSPGNNPAGTNFGTVGTFTLRGGYGNGQTSLAATLASGSNLDLDIASLSSYDSFQLTGGEYSTGKTLNITNGAIVNINAIGALQPGTYHIITESSSGTFFVITDGGFVIGSAPAGFTYTFADLAGNAGIDLIVAAAVGPTNATWATNVDGRWSQSPDWTGGVPNSAGSTANFTGNTLAAVNVDAPQTVGRILISGATNYTIGGSAITLNNTGGTGTNMVISSAGGTQVINSALVTTAGTVDVTVSAGSLTLGGNISGPANMTLAGPGTLVLNGSNSNGSITLNSGTLGGSGTLTGNVLAGSGAHTILPSATLTGTNTAKLTMGGLTTNSNTTLSFKLVTRGTYDLTIPATPVLTVPSVNDSLNITGPSSLALGGGTLSIVNDPANVGPNSLGYYRAIQYNGTFTGVYNSTSILIPAVNPANKITYTLDIARDPGYIDIHRGFQGDANDDGTVTFADFVKLSNNFGLADKGWFGGDFNGDGVTNFADFVLLSNNFGLTVGGSSLLSSDEIAAFHAETANFGASSVPEPASLILLGLGGVGLLTRRRRA